MIVVFLFFGDSWVGGFIGSVVPASLGGVNRTSSSPYSVFNYVVDWGISRGLGCGR
jgi:hypothetical protein